MKKKKKYDLYIKEKLKVRDYLVIIVYLLLNIIPPLFLKDNGQIGAYFILISIISTAIFGATDYLKSTRNIFLAITWLILYGFVCFYHTNLLLNTFTVDDGNLLKIVRLPIVDFVYTQVFRIMFVLTYQYEPSAYGGADRILQNIFGKNTKNREDYIWFILGRVLMFFVLMLFVMADY